MSKKLIVLLLTGALSTALIPPSLSAPKLLKSDKAIVNSRCNEANKFSMSKSGPLICSKGIWKLVLVSQDTVSTRAYRSLLTRYNSMPNIAPNLILRVDPTAGEWKNKIVTGFIAAARLWGTSTPQDKALPLYISENAEYISENLAKDGLRENPEDAQRNKEAAARGGGQAGSHGPYFDFIFSNQSSQNSGFYQVGPHEYTHYSQLTFSKSRAPQLPREFWLEEGCSTFVGTNMGGIIGMPQNQREEIVGNIQRQAIPTKISDFSQSTPELYSNPIFGDIYDNGSIACEAVVAVAGIDSLEKLYRELSTEGTSFDSASRKVFKMSLNSLVTFVQSYLDSVKAKKPTSLTSLTSSYKALQSQ